MAIPVSQTFTGTNGTDLETSHPGFDNVFNAFSIMDNTAIGTINADTRALWTTDSFSADQISSAVIQGLSSGTGYRGAIARGSGNAGSYNAYECITDGASGSGHTEIAKVTNGTYGALKAVATTFTTDDKIGCRTTTVGSDVLIELLKNDSVIDSFTDTSSPHTTGQPGIYAYGANSPGLVSWTADNVASGPAEVTGTGALTAAAATSSGSGTVDGGLQAVTGTGALTAALPTASGAGSRGLHDLPGPIALSSAIPTVSGTGTVDTPSVPDVPDVTGSGAMQAPIAAASGLGIRGITGTGACSIVIPSVRGFDVLPAGRVYQEFGFGLGMRF